MSDILDPDALLEDVAQAIPRTLHAQLVVVGSIASAYAFRGLVAAGAVATKDIDVVVRPALNATAFATDIANELLRANWRPHFNIGMSAERHAPPRRSFPRYACVHPGITSIGSWNSSAMHRGARGNSVSGSASRPRQAISDYRVSAICRSPWLAQRNRRQACTSVCPRTSRWLICCSIKHPT